MEKDLQAPIPQFVETALQAKPPFITEEMEVVYETAPKPDPTFDPPRVDLSKFPRFQNEIQEKP